MSFFSDQTIIVIGASGAFGRSTAEALVEAGADVRLVVRDAGRVPASLRDCAVVEADIRDRAALADAVDRVLAGDALFGVVNAAGVVAFGPLHELSAPVARELLDTNAGGTLNVVSIAASRVVEGGFVASFTGVAADMSLTGMAAYCASKAAAKSAMAVAARELRSRKVLVLDVRAPHTETGLVGRALEGTAPTMPKGLDPDDVVARVLEALATGERDLPASAFNAG